MALAIEVIAIGNEILTGFTVNSNVAVIGQALLSIGLKVTAQRALPDDPKLLTAGLQHSFDNNDLIICTGGLGPTCDDQTRQIIAKFFNCELKFEPKIAAHLEQLYVNRPVSIADQAQIPSKAEYILNDIGTASALIFNEAGKLIIFLPGVPAELQHFMYNHIVPLLATKYSGKRSEFHQQCSFMQLSESQVDPVLRQLSIDYPKVEFGIYPMYGTITVHIVSHFATVRQDQAYQQPILEKLIATFQDSFYSTSSSDIETSIWPLCKAQDLRIGLLQTSPDLNLCQRLAPVLQGSLFCTSKQTPEQLIATVFEQFDCELAVVVTNLPTIDQTEQIYTAELNIALQQHGQNSKITTFSIRGNKMMLTRRAENLVLGELFKHLHYNA